MQVERTEFQTVMRQSPDGKVDMVSDKVVKRDTFEFGSPDDVMTKIIGGGYIQQWLPDFLQDLGQRGSFSRYYFDTRVAVDIGDPEAKISRKKRIRLHKHGFAYLCIPPDFPTEEGSLRKLYRAALDEYRAYEELHPRPVQIQDGIIVDEKGTVRRAKVRAMDVIVGGGISGSLAQQQQDFQNAEPLGKGELKTKALLAEAYRKIRKAKQTGKPFRNPFVGPNERKYPIQYAS